MDIAIPVAPLGIITLLGFFAPYAVGPLNGILPFVTKPVHRKLVSIAVAVALAVVVMVFYFAITREPVTDWWLFTLLAIVVVNASYALITRDLGAKQLERKADPVDAGTADGSTVPDISSIPEEVLRRSDDDRNQG